MQFANRVFNRDIKHILLIHAAPFTALMLNDLLTAFENIKVQFISLEDAAKDPVYQINPNRIGQYTGTFLFQVGSTKGLKYPNVPTEDPSSFCPQK